MRYRSAAPSAASPVLRVLAVLVTVVAAAVLAAPLASAAETAPAASAAELRAQADDLANRYFDALTRFQSLDGEIARNQQLVVVLSARAKEARAAVRARALIAYKTSGTQLSVLIGGESSLDASRRAELIDRVNASDEKVYGRLRDATRDLHRQQQLLEENRRAQADALTQLRDQGATIDAKLAEASRQEQAARAATAAAATATTAPAATANDASPAAGTTAPPPTTAGPAAPPPSTPTPPPGYSGTPGTSAHHDDPFLTCVRQRESGGNYSAVNPAGPYLGAYQFLQATWNVSASHAGRSDLVGVPVNTASPYDQDEIAWALYQWQGMGPWGGSCP